MKTIIFFLSLCPNVFAGPTAIQTQDIGASTIAVSAGWSYTGFSTHAVSSTEQFYGSDNFFHRVSSGSGAGATSFTIASGDLGGVSASNPSWHAEIALTQNTSGGIWKLNWNNDTSAQYYYGASILRAVSGVDSIVGSSQTACNVVSANTAGAGTNGKIELWWTTSQSSVNIVLAHGFVIFDDATSPGSGGSFTCQFNGTAAPTSLKITASAGTVTYRWRVERNDW